jgi:hypothetical protein
VLVVVSLVEVGEGADSGRRIWISYNQLGEEGEGDVESAYVLLVIPQSERYFYRKGCSQYSKHRGGPRLLRLGPTPRSRQTWPGQEQRPHSKHLSGGPGMPIGLQGGCWQLGYQARHLC